MHKKDFSSRRGLIRKVAERRRLLNYLHREDETDWEELVKKLKLKTPKPEHEKLSTVIPPEEREEVIEDAKKEVEEKSSKE